MYLASLKRKSTALVKDKDSVTSCIYDFHTGCEHIYFSFYGCSWHLVGGVIGAASAERVRSDCFVGI